MVPGRDEYQSQLSVGDLESETIAVKGVLLIEQLAEYVFDVAVSWHDLLLSVKRGYLFFALICLGTGFVAEQ